MSNKPESSISPEIGTRIRVERERLKISRNKFADMVGVALSTLQAWENQDQGREPAASSIIKIAELLNVSVEYLLLGEDSKNKYLLDSNTKQISATNVDINEFVFIPRYDVEASAGYGAYPDSESMLSSMAFRKHWVKNILRINPDKLSVITVRGDSMTPELNDKDIILVHHADNEPKDGIYVLRVDGDVIVKRIQKMPGNTLTVISTNTIYREFTIDLDKPPQDFEVIGKVIWSAGMII